MNQERLMKVLLGSVSSEKASLVEGLGGQYVFRVATDATKREIGRAVELLFQVKVEQVRVLNVRGKQKRFGRRLGKRGDWRKAYVRLLPEYHIDFGGDHP